MSSENMKTNEFFAFSIKLQVILIRLSNWICIAINICHKLGFLNTLQMTDNNLITTLQPTRFSYLINAFPDVIGMILSTYLPAKCLLQNFLNEEILK